MKKTENGKRGLKNGRVNRKKWENNENTKLRMNGKNEEQNNQIIKYKRQKIDE